MIDYQDKSLQVSYLQIFLKEFFGITLVKYIPTKASSKSYYYETVNSPLRVTGYYNIETYASLALYMSYNYPEEGYPYKWTKGIDGVWSSIGCIYDEEALSIEKSIKLISDYISDPDSVSILDLRKAHLILLSAYDRLRADGDEGEYKQSQIRQVVTDLNFFDANSDDWMNIDTLKGYWSSNKILFAYLTDYTGKYHTSDIKSIIIENMEQSPYHKESIQVPDRVLSYIFNEVVTEKSTPEEILRIKSMIYSLPIGPKYALRYNDDLTKMVKAIQKSFIKNYTNGNKIVSLPDQYKGFRVTGYVDPWTELCIKGGLDIYDT